jgi:hypothetical protein
MVAKRMGKMVASYLASVIAESYEPLLVKLADSLSVRRFGRVSNIKNKFLTIQGHSVTSENKEWQSDCYHEETDEGIPFSSMGVI